MSGSQDITDMNSFDPLKFFNKTYEPLDILLILCDPMSCVEREVQHVGK